MSSTPTALFPKQDGYIQRLIDVFDAHGSLPKATSSTAHRPSSLTGSDFKDNFVAYILGALSFAANMTRVDIA
ncbi:hypothetical protein SARC_04249 [Sphaeroforma arctica JP610]|uniref:Uncharacterized protein n=1 Tax=Sphaeroforma arctica JP610 TaxID=667725 RepID=A0A0L0G3S9_9EUKA|nr:hypothetical protein SARC_04249 [Sphaeroforma arctica JP610]KNC83491.1 hypothetical protein SARC_04249 [Sphaeroforma arctica JP610]|eukprot:XP_014157393.1 hypothetical protein SARC_04249 [Sphaeroforma arctica JP610]